MKQRTKKALGVVPAALALALATALPAHAAPVADISEGPADILAIAGNVTVKGDTATLSFVYKCSGAAPAVWASVKQLKDPRATAPWTFDSHGTSAASHAWYDMHTVAPCHGKKASKLTVTMRRADFSAGGGPKWEQLRKGVGYVQLCLTQGGSEDPSGPPPTAFAAFNDWVQVKSK